MVFVRETVYARRRASTVGARGQRPIRGVGERWRLERNWPETVRRARKSCLRAGITCQQDGVPCC